MKFKIIIGVCFLLVNVIFVSSEEPKDNLLIFSGKVVFVGPMVGPSGNIAQYQKVKYSVASVCEGNYSDDEITTEHLILDPYELKDLKVGDSVCVGAIRKNVPDYQFIKEKQDFLLVGEKTVYRVNDIFIRNCSCNRRN